MRRLLVSAIILTALFSCSESDHDSEQSKIINEMAWLYKAKPIDDFELAVTKLDFRFIGLYGEGANVPIVNIKCLDYSKGIKFIAGTSDALLGYEHVKLNAIAKVYANDYNLRMLRYLTEHRGFKCAL